MNKPGTAFVVIDEQESIVNPDCHIGDLDIMYGGGAKPFDAPRQIVAKISDRTPGKGEFRVSGFAAQSLPHQAERICRRFEQTAVLEDPRDLTLCDKSGDGIPRHDVVATRCIAKAAAVEQNKPWTLGKTVHAGDRIVPIRDRYCAGLTKRQFVIHANFATATAGAAMETCSASSESAPINASKLW